MKKLFGTDGMRGRAGAFPLNQKTVEIVGRSLARQLKEKLNRQPRFITGRDTRESGGWIERAFHAGAIAAGAHCESAQIMTTPGVAFLAGKFDFDAGVVISASHNPFEDNGIKIFSPTGRKIDAATERKIEEDIFRESDTATQRRGGAEILESEKPEENQKPQTENRASEYQNAYLNYLAGEFENLSLENFKMVVDCANGAASHLAPQLFERFGATIFPINNEPEGRNINKNCGSLHLEGLQEKVLDKNADFGAAFDGDADRALFVDENGRLVDGDATLWAMATHLKAHGALEKDMVVATVMSNLGLELALGGENIKLRRTDVGDKYVLQELLETGANLGGEQSGHIIFPQKSLVGDGMLTTLFLLETIRQKKKTLSEITAGFARLPQILVNVKVREKQPFETIAEIAETMRMVEYELGAKGRILLRYSGTENLARVMIEGENQTEIEAQANRLAEIIRANLG
ncbi:MAG: phosphoglucosamine mutase [Pyrinomonadaceae bacterium]